MDMSDRTFIWIGSHHHSTQLKCHTFLSWRCHIACMIISCGRWTFKILNTFWTGTLDSTHSSCNMVSAEEPPEEELRTSQTTPLESLSERLTFPEVVCLYLQIVILCNLDPIRMKSDSSSCPVGSPSHGTQWTIQYSSGFETFVLWHQTWIKTFRGRHWSIGVWIGFQMATERQVEDDSSGPGCLPEHWSRPPRCHQNLAVRQNGMLDGSPVCSSSKGTRDYRKESAGTVWTMAAKGQI